MGHKQKADIYQEVAQQLKGLHRFGESKFEAKQETRSAGSGPVRLDGIYSFSTARAYQRECMRFAEYVSAKAPEGRHTSLKAAYAYAPGYIEQLNANAENSAYSVKLARSAVAKLYGVAGSELGETRQRSRAEISRGRHRTVVSEKTGKVIKNHSVRSGRFSEEKHKDLVEFAKATGLRREELRRLRGDRLVERDGRYFLELRGSIDGTKGGKCRDVPVREEYAAKVVELCHKAGHERVFQTVPGTLDQHYYRGVYAKELYKEALERKQASGAEINPYYCRGDRAGEVYDRDCMAEVSQALGHTRISVIAGHYLYEN